MNVSYICASCRQSLRSLKCKDAAPRRSYTRPSFAPKPALDLKHIRQNPGLYEQNCHDRNYAPFAKNSWQILELHELLIARQKDTLLWRKRSNAIGKEVGQHVGNRDGSESNLGKTTALETLLSEAKDLKIKLAAFEEQEKGILEQMELLALQLPNLSSMRTPVGDEPELLELINAHHPNIGKQGRSHVEIGRDLDIVDFESSATTSGWGWYFLKNEGALLEQALIQYALSVALARGWQVMTPPSMVYSHIASACGFNPRDQNGETQIYDIASNDSPDDTDKHRLVLTGTAEIPFAGSQANRSLSVAQLPLKVIGPSRCYRAEAGARGVDTKGLYRVHEFTKVEMFAWSLPDLDRGADRFGPGDEVGNTPSEQIFDEMIAIQKEILTSLDLHAKVLEMPSADLGASATRKIDIEAFFPSRLAIDAGFGEVTSASICTDYQSRRLATRLRDGSGSNKPSWPFTVNGTALAVPRVLACIIENHWDEDTGRLHVPQVLKPFMPGNGAPIEQKAR